MTPPKKPSVKKVPKRPAKPSRPLKPIKVGRVKLPRKRWGPRDLDDRYTNGRLRKKLVEEIEALKRALAAEKRKTARKPKRKPPKPKKPRKSRQQRGFEILEDAIEKGIRPLDIHDPTGESYFKYIAELTKMSERDVYATLMGSPPEIGVAA